MQADVAAINARLDRLVNESRASAAASLNLVTESRRLLVSSSRLLSESRYLVAKSRRHLNPWFAFAGGSDDEWLRSRVSARLANGALFPIEPGSFCWAGFGSGKPCGVCDAPVGGAEVEYEITRRDGAGVLAHLICFMAWNRESDAIREARAT